MSAIAAIPAHADALARLEAGDTGAVFLHPARDFMTGDAGKLHAGPLPLLEDLVAMADAAGLDLDQDLTGAGLRDGTFHEFERTACFRDLRDEHEYSPVEGFGDFEDQLRKS